MTRPLRICIVTPAPPGTASGNLTTAERWAAILASLPAGAGAPRHEVHLARSWEGAPCDLLLALHAKKSAGSIARFHEAHPASPIVLALTGTDLYGDIGHDDAARRSLALATRLVLLQPRGLDVLAPDLRAKARTIHQSSSRPDRARTVATDAFSVCVSSNLRAVKDPLRTAEASRRLPASSRIKVVHLGGALDDEMAEAAREEMRRNPRYLWLGGRPRAEALEILAGSRLLALTSLTEGGANVVTEALACGVPVVSSRIEGSIGLLGEDYPGYFPVGDTAALAALLLRVEMDTTFRSELEARCRALAHLADPATERERWRCLLEELFPARS